MRIAFFDTKEYDRREFDRANAVYGFDIEYFDDKLNASMARYLHGFDVACAFVNDEIDAATIHQMQQCGVGLLAMRCAGYNNVDLDAAKDRIQVVRVPGYSPYAVAEHTAALMFGVNRRIHKAYNRTRESNFSINGLMGMDLHGKTAGIIGTGQIGRCFINICRGIGMNLLAYDPYPQPDLDVTYTSLDEIYAQSDIISLHCPLTSDSHYLLQQSSFDQMKPGVLILNTSRGALIKADDLIESLKSGHVGGAGLDVYEEESDYFFEDFSSEIIKDDALARLLTFPNVIVTSHQAFFTQEAYDAIAHTTLESIQSYAKGQPLQNEIRDKSSF